MKFQNLALTLAVIFSGAMSFGQECTETQVSHGCMTEITHTTPYGGSAGCFYRTLQGDYLCPFCILEEKVTLDVSCQTVSAKHCYPKDGCTYYPKTVCKTQAVCSKGVSSESQGE